MARRSGVRWLLAAGLCFAAASLIAVLLRRDSQPRSVAYRGNESNLVFHGASCRFFRARSSSRCFPSREAAVAAGYQPCELCKP